MRLGRKSKSSCQRPKEKATRPGHVMKLAREEEQDGSATFRNHKSIRVYKGKLACYHSVYSFRNRKGLEEMIDGKTFNNFGERGSLSTIPHIEDLAQDLWKKLAPFELSQLIHELEKREKR